jgi:hypothetical protein
VAVFGRAGRRSIHGGGNVGLICIQPGSDTRNAVFQVRGLEGILVRGVNVLLSERVSLGQVVAWDFQAPFGADRCTKIRFKLWAG